MKPVCPRSRWRDYETRDSIETTFCHLQQKSLDTARQQRNMPGGNTSAFAAVMEDAGLVKASLGAPDPAAECGSASHRNDARCPATAQSSSLLFGRIHDAIQRSSALIGPNIVMAPLFGPLMMLLTTPPPGTAVPSMGRC
jgi:hypothetical protein